MRWQLLSVAAPRRFQIRVSFDVRSRSRMNRSRTSFAAMLIALAVLAAHADEWTPARSFRTFGKANWRGLPQSSVAALAQDQDGVLWVGTLDGTATFDGKS